jgi:hypothetical protein
MLASLLSATAGWPHMRGAERGYSGVYESAFTGASGAGAQPSRSEVATIRSSNFRSRGIATATGTGTWQPAQVSRLLAWP